jgi:hypothetical protein
LENNDEHKGKEISLMDKGKRTVSGNGSTQGAFNHLLKKILEKKHANKLQRFSTLLWFYLFVWKTLSHLNWLQSMGQVSSLSHKSKDWLMSLTTEIEKTKRGLSLEKRCWFSPNWNTIRLLDHNWSCRTWIKVWFICMES